MRIKTLAASALATTTLLALSTAAYADTGAPAPTSPSGTTASAPPAAATPGGPSGTCDPDSQWPAYVEGAPTNFKAGSDGVFLWHNPAGGWGLRASHPRLPGKADHVVFSGAIGSAGVFGNVKGVDLEKNDSVKVSADGHVLTFRFNNWGAVDGVDFTTTCTPGLKVGLKDDGQPFQTRFIHLGAKEVHPGSDPFVIRRVSTDTSTSGSGTAAPTPPSS